jgi:hypothetical protein
MADITGIPSKIVDKTIDAAFEPTKVDPQRELGSTADNRDVISGKLPRGKGLGGVRTRIDARTDSTAKAVEQFMGMQPALYGEIEQLLNKYGFGVQDMYNQILQTRDNSGNDVWQSYNKGYMNNHLAINQKVALNQIDLATAAQNGIATGMSFAGMLGVGLKFLGAVTGDTQYDSMGNSVIGFVQQYTPKIPGTVNQAVVPDLQESHRPKVEFAPKERTNAGNSFRTNRQATIETDLPERTVTMERDSSRRLEDMSGGMRGETPENSGSGSTPRTSREALPISSRGGPVDPREQTAARQTLRGAIDRTSVDYAKAAGMDSASFSQVLDAIAMRESAYGARRFVANSALPSTAGGSFHFLDGTVEGKIEQRSSNPDILKRVTALGINPSKMGVRESERAKNNDDLSSRIVALDVIDHVRANPALRKNPLELATEVFMTHNMGSGGKNALIKSGVDGLQTLGQKGQEIVANNPTYFRGATTYDQVRNNYREDMRAMMGQSQELRTTLADLERNATSKPKVSAEQQPSVATSGPKIDRRSAIEDAKTSSTTKVTTPGGKELKAEISMKPDYDAVAHNTTRPKAPDTMSVGRNAKAEVLAVNTAQNDKPAKGSFADLSKPAVNPLAIFMEPPGLRMQ